MCAAPFDSSPLSWRQGLIACVMQAAAKRYKITGTGKVLTRRPGKQHMNQKMSRQHKRKLSSLRGVEKSDFNNVASLLPGQKLKK